MPLGAFTCKGDAIYTWRVFRSFKRKPAAYEGPLRMRMLFASLLCQFFATLAACLMTLPTKPSKCSTKKYAVDGSNQNMRK